MAGLGNHLRNSESSAQNRVIAGEPAVGAIIHAFVRNVERSEHPHRFSKMMLGEALAFVSHSF